MNRALQDFITRVMITAWRLPLPGWLRPILMTVANPRFVVTASAVVISAQGEVLLFNHTYRRPLSWGLPGGFLKLNEEPAAAVKREIREESGLEVCVERPLWAGRDPNFPCINLIFAGSLSGGTFRPSHEVSEARFFAPEALPVLSTQMQGIILLALNHWEERKPVPLPPSG